MASMRNRTHYENEFITTLFLHFFNEPLPANWSKLSEDKRAYLGVLCRTATALKINDLIRFVEMATGRKHFGIREWLRKDRTND